MLLARRAVFSPAERLVEGSKCEYCPISWMSSCAFKFGCINRWSHDSLHKRFWVVEVFKSVLVVVARSDRTRWSLCHIKFALCALMAPLCYYYLRIIEFTKLSNNLVERFSSLIIVVTICVQKTFINFEFFQRIVRNVSRWFAANLFAGGKLFSL